MLFVVLLSRARVHISTLIQQRQRSRSEMGNKLSPPNIKIFPFASMVFFIHFLSNRISLWKSSRDRDSYLPHSSPIFSHLSDEYWSSKRGSTYQTTICICTRLNRRVVESTSSTCWASTDYLFQHFVSTEANLWLSAGSVDDPRFHRWYQNPRVSLGSKDANRIQRYYQVSWDSTMNQRCYEDP